MRSARRFNIRLRRTSACAFVAAALTAIPSVALACDLCAIYTATEELEGRTGVRLGVAEQYTQYTTERIDGHEVPNVFGEHLYSSNTQVFAGYQFNRRFGLQVNLPILVKSWRRVVGDGEIQESTRGGIGDLTLIGNVLAFDAVSDTGVFRFGLLGGLELPTGDAGFLKEELQEGGGGGEAEAGLARPQHADHEHETPSGVHGHDLTFGSGSVDGIVGGNLYWSYDRFFTTVSAQYKITTEGAFEYEFANDLSWLGGPGYYVWLEHGYTLGVQALLSGETKGNDHQAGHKLDDTAVTTLYVGPGIDFTWGANVSLDIEADLPVVQNDTSLQIVPDFRLRGAVVWRF
ncbi:MAG TPA: hypothetical protein VFD92_18015 [Candidatus Binatia bacterium]|nr:hypothetical protein [Candidatus Binatia bacterium]